MTVSEFIIISNIFTNKSYDFIKKLWVGNTREVDRFEQVDSGNILIAVYTHLSNLSKEPSFIIDNLYLGNAYNATNEVTLKKFGIEAVINVTREIPSPFIDTIQYKNIPINDTRDSFIGNYLEDAYDFIIANKHNNHCI